ncbi:MAG: thermonuclease family protein [Sphingomonas sp.]
MKKALLLVATPTLLLTCAAAEVQAPIWGTASAQDGDSLFVDGRRVRLFGIDAPELDQTCSRNGQNWACGEAAADQLMQLVTGKQVMCTLMGVDEYQRILGRCSVGAVEINKTMVAVGYAVAYRHYSSDYVSSEESAKANRLGLWGGTFQLPSEYRQVGKARASSEPRRTARVTSSDWFGRARANCNIKGNRNRRGQWIYHLPGMPYYEQTRPEEIFCTEQEALAAGYRRAIVR